MRDQREDAAPTEALERADYAGAVYGSLLAASVTAGSSSREDPAPPVALAILLLVSGLVFWLAHVYAHLAGDPHPGSRPHWARVRAVAAREWPMAQAAVPPALAALACWALGLPDLTASWAALVAAVGGQVGWSVVAASRAHGAGRVIVRTALVSLLLGMVIVALKVLVTH